MPICPVCGTDITYGSRRCKGCRSGLLWRDGIPASVWKSPTAALIWKVVITLIVIAIVIMVAILIWH